MRKTVLVLGWIVNFVLGLVGIGIHIWSVYIVYTMNGIFGAIVSLFLPVISQIYLIIMGYNISHTWITQYSLTVFAYAVSALILKVLINLISKYIFKKEETTGTTRLI